MLIKLHNDLDALFKGNLGFPLDENGYIELPCPNPDDGTFLIRLLRDDPIVPNLEVKHNETIKLPLLSVSTIYTALIAYGGEMYKGGTFTPNELGSISVFLESVDGFIAHYVENSKYGEIITRKSDYVVAILKVLDLCEVNDDDLVLIV